jgi:hypothetical protein
MAGFADDISDGTDVCMFRAIMRVYSYLYHFLLCLFLAGVGAIALFSRSNRLNLPMLPWEEPTLTYWLFFGGLAGLLSLYLAYKGTLRLPFRLWTVVVLAMMIYGFFVSRHSFRDAGEFFNALLLTLGALAAVAGSWLRVPRRV